MNGLALEYVGDLHHIHKGAVGAGAYADLIDLEPADLGNGLDVIGRMGAGGHRNDSGEVDIYLLVIYGVVIGLQLCPDIGSVLSLKELKGDLVGGEDRGSSAQLCAHIGDSCALGDGKGLDAFAAIFDDLADAALNGEPFQHLKDNVLGGHPRRELSGEVHLDDLGVGDIVSAAAHCNGHIKAAGTDSDHADAAAGGGVAVGADQGFAGYAESFKMHLMTDAVAGAGEPDAVLFGDRADEAVVVGILEAGLEGVMVDISNRALGLDSRNADSLKFKVSHCAGSVLREGLVDADADLVSLYELAVNDVSLQYFFGKCKSHFKPILSFSNIQPLYHIPSLLSITNTMCW